MMGLNGTNKPLITVIIPAFNVEEFIEDAIHSILSQTYTNIEILIADDCSNDKTREVIDSIVDSRIRLFHNEYNLGPVGTRNNLSKHTLGEYIVFQDGDDWSEPTRIEKQLNEFLLNSKLGICGTWVQYVYENGEKSHLTKKSATNHNDIVEQSKTQNQFAGATLMIPTGVFNEVGGFDVFFNTIGNEDYFLAYSIQTKYESKNIGEFLYCARINKASFSRNFKSVDQVIGPEIIQFLFKEKDVFLVKNKVDSKNEKLNDKLNELREPYKKDNSLIFRKEADIKAYQLDFKGALNSALKAMITKPMILMNWKYVTSLSLRFVLNKFQ